MTDREVGIGCVVSYGMWVLAVGLIVIAAVTGAERVAWVGMAALAVAITASVRGYFVHHDRMMRDAFNLGREAAREPVRPLR